MMNMPMGQNFQPQMFMPQQMPKVDKSSSESLPPDQSVTTQIPPADQIKKAEVIEEKIKEATFVEPPKQFVVPPDPAITMINKQEIIIQKEIPQKSPAANAHQSPSEQKQGDNNQENKEKQNDNSKQKEDAPK